jgi:hypothetical protein
MSLPVRSLGQNGPALPAPGLGPIGKRDFHGPAIRATCIAASRAAMQAGGIARGSA